MSFANKLKLSDGFAALKPAAEEQIKTAEEALQLNFSAEYKEYVAAYGAACLRGHELTGVCSSKRLDVVSVTEEHKSENPDIGSDMYVIEELNIDGLTVWQNAKGEVFITRPGSGVQKEADSIEAYLGL